MHPCACDPWCGEHVREGSTWKRGHFLRNKNNPAAPLPGPNDGDLDAGEVGDPLAYTNEPGTAFDDDWLADQSEPPDDPEPGHVDTGKAKRSRRGKDKGPSQPVEPIKVTAAVRKDVAAKIRFITKPVAELWNMRDPVCGGITVQQEPEISAAMADIVCDSPDLLAFFTGPAGGFMKYVRLMMAAQPVAIAWWAHRQVHAEIAQARAQGLVVTYDAQQPMQPAWGPA